MRCFLATLMSIGLLGCADGAPSAAPFPGPSFAASANTERTVFQLHAQLFNSCTDEDVLFDGPINIVFHVTENAAGGLTLNGSANFQGVSGVGTQTGLKYQLVGRSIRGFNGPVVLAPGGTFVSQFQISQTWVSHDSEDNLAFLTNIVFVIDANGNVVTNVFIDKVTCRG